MPMVSPSTFKRLNHLSFLKLRSAINNKFLITVVALN
jgi:hypothetical protein